MESIVFIVARYWPAVGGVESLIRTVARGLSHRYEVTVLARQIDERPVPLEMGFPRFQSFDQFMDGSVTVRPLSVPLFDRAAIAPLLSLQVPGIRRYSHGRLRTPFLAYYGRVVGAALSAQAGKADVLHSWSADLLGAAAIFAGRKRGIPVALSPFAHPRHYGTDSSAAWLYRQAEGIIALLETDRNVYINMGVAPSKIRISGACSPGVKKAGGSLLRQARGIDGPLILFLGAKRPYKGVDILLKAAHILGLKCPGLTFAFVGPGPSIQSSKAGSSRILDRGNVDEDERAAWLDAADVLCLPSEFEIFPISALEAWSVETPVLWSSLPSLQEISQLSGGALTFERDPEALANAIAYLVKNPDILRALALGGNRFWAQSCQPAQAVLRHEAIYRQLRSPA